MEDLGASSADLFKSFDSTPIAAASLAQARAMRARKHLSRQAVLRQSALVMRAVGAADPAAA